MPAAIVTRAPSAAKAEQAASREAKTSEIEAGADLAMVWSFQVLTF